MKMFWQMALCFRYEKFLINWKHGLNNNFVPAKLLRGSQVYFSMGESQKGCAGARRNSWGCGCAFHNWKPTYLTTSTTPVFEEIWMFRIIGPDRSCWHSELQVVGQITWQTEVLRMIKSIDQESDPELPIMVIHDDVLSWKKPLRGRN